MSMEIDFYDGFGGWNAMKFVWLRKKSTENSVKSV